MTIETTHSCLVPLSILNYLPSAPFTLTHHSQHAYFCFNSKAFHQHLILTFATEPSIDPFIHVLQIHIIQVQ